jgi:glyoxylase-like metal-dependent hydrolase (beta-lactamase superfamily II)
MRLNLLPALFAILAVACSPPPADDVRDNEQVENRGVDQDEWWDALPLSEWQAFEPVPVESEWFEVYRLDDDLYAIYEPGQFELVISYLILGAEQALLFDTGPGIGDIRAIVAGLTDLPVAVLNSHSHYDHIGGNYQFSVILGLDNKYTRTSAAGSSPGAIAEFIGPGWVWKPFPAGFEPGKWRSRPYTVTRIVRDGDRIALGGLDLEIFETPGHAPDALCLLDRANGRLFTGDTFYLAPLYAHLPGSDVADYQVSAGRLAALEPAVRNLVTAHNVPFASPDHLSAMHDAFVRIEEGGADYILTDGNREYAFGDFSIILPDPPQPATPVETAP